MDTDLWSNRISSKSPWSKFCPLFFHNRDVYFLFILSLASRTPDSCCNTRFCVQIPRISFLIFIRSCVWYLIFLYFCFSSITYFACYTLEFGSKRDYDDFCQDLCRIFFFLYSFTHRISSPSCLATDLLRFSHTPPTPRVDRPLFVFFFVYLLYVTCIALSLFSIV